MNLALHLRQKHVPGAVARAWFLSGNSAARWLEALSRCGLATPETRLFPIPHSASDRSVAGLLVVPGGADGTWEPPPGMPCRLLADRLFVPLDAVLHPPVSDAEVRALCPLPVTFFHPALGVSGFEPESALRAWDLLERPHEQAGTWNAACPGAESLPDLKRIMLEAPLSIEQVFGDAKENIGTRSLAELPPASDEPVMGLFALSVNFARELLFEAVLNLMKGVPRVGTQRTWVNDLEDWAVQQKSQLDGELERLRLRELGRLLRMLTDDPEKGLRHAIPLGAFGHRGVAPPGARLQPRLPEFDLSRLGGMPADTWLVPGELQEELRARYRQMADLQLRLGRFRRAAYIYAQLLGDMVSAANALNQGRLFREAAFIYEQILQNPIQAARCLAEGGLLVEAIEHYERLAMWLEVADLQKRLGNREAEEAAVRRVVDARMAEDNVLSAAHLLEHRLQKPEEALQRLLGAWPRSRQAVRCMEASFDLLGRLGRHEVVRQRLAEFRRETLPAEVLPRLVKVMVGVAKDYPDGTVRHLAADLARVMITHKLQQPELRQDAARNLVLQLVQLVPHDRLLARDGRRYLEARLRESLGPQCRIPGSSPGKALEVVHRLELPRQIRWMVLRQGAGGSFAAGVTANRVNFVRWNRQDQIQSASWRMHDTSNFRPDDLVLEQPRFHTRMVALAVARAPGLQLKTLPSLDDYCGSGEFLVGTPEFLTHGKFPFVYGMEGVWALHRAADRTVLSCHNVEGNLLRTIDVTQDMAAARRECGNARPHLCALRGGVALAAGHRLLHFGKGDQVTLTQLPSPAAGLIPVDQPGDFITVVRTEDGTTFLVTSDNDLIQLGGEVRPCAGVSLRTGKLVLISSDKIVCCLAEEDSFRAPVVLKAPLQDLVDVASWDNEFICLLGARGDVATCRILW